MSLFVPATSSDMPGWVRKIANAVNFLLGQRDFPLVRLDAAPTAPEEGQAYYDTVLHKGRIWDGTTWQALW